MDQLSQPRTSKSTAAVVTTAVGLGLGAALFLYENRDKIRNFFKSRQCERQIEERIEEKVCSMCFSKMTPLHSFKLPCNHWFHGKCLKVLFDPEVMAKNCPVCREEVPQEVINNLLKNIY